MTTAHRTARRATRLAGPLGLALVAALALSPALAQDAATDAATDASATTDAAPRAGAFFLRRGPDGGLTLRGLHLDPRDAGARAALGRRLEGAAARRHERFERSEGDDRRGDALARWLGADADAGPIVPGLVGRVAAGTTVRLVFYDGAPEAGGAERAALTFVAGEGDPATFRDAVRSAAEDATHVVVDVLGRVVALPGAPAAGAAE